VCDLSSYGSDLSALPVIELLGRRGVTSIPVSVIRGRILQSWSTLRRHWTKILQVDIVNNQIREGPGLAGRVVTVMSPDS